MCILVTYYRCKLNQKKQEFVLQLEDLKKKQVNTEPYPTIISKGRNARMNKKCQSEYKGIRDVSRSFATWTEAEDDWLLKRYNKSKSIETLATLHKRTPSAIAIRLKELKIYV
mgnify:CR=1 FL=1